MFLRNFVNFICLAALDPSPMLCYIYKNNFGTIFLK